MSKQFQVDAVRARLLPDATVQAIEPRIPVLALRAHLRRRHFNVERVKREAQRAHVAVDSSTIWGGHTEQSVRVFWPDGTVDRLDNIILEPDPPQQPTFTSNGTP